MNIEIVLEPSGVWSATTEMFGQIFVSIHENKSIAIRGLFRMVKEATA